MRVDVLGSLRALDDHMESVVISDSKIAGALLVLALEAGRPVAAEALVQAVYGRDGLCGLEEDWVAGHVADLQKLLGSASDGAPYVRESATGAARYELHLDPSEVDALEFSIGVENLLRHGLDLSLEERVATGRAMFALWRADPIAQHRRICRTASRLFKRHQRLYRRLGELLARDLDALGDRDAAEDVLDAVLDVCQGDADLLVLKEALEAATVRAGDAATDPRSGEGRRALAGPESLTFHVIEGQCEMAVVGLTNAWRTMSASLMTEGIRSVLDDLDRLLPEDAEVTALVREVASSGPGVDVTVLLKSFWPDLRRHEAQQRLAAAVARANARFGRLPRNQLHEFSLIRSAVDRGGDVEHVVTIGSVGIAELLSRSPKGIRLMEPNLRVAWGLYDAGSYSAALQRFAAVAESVTNGRVLTRTELALFFYYFAKCLLKLNMYAPLEQFIETSYQEFASVACPELEPERLQIAGVLHRHVGNISSAQNCLDEAVSQLEAVADSQTPPVVWRALADAEVLRCHPRLDIAVTPGPELGRRACIRFARGALDRARGHLERFWQESGETTHYEGRLGGTQAFTTVAEAVVRPDALDEDAWARAFRHARSSFEPEHDRKPVGIVAGRATLAAVNLARAHWLRAAGAGDDGVRAALTAADDALQVALTVHLPAVELGPRFEHRKLRALADAIDAALRDPGAALPADALSPIL